MTSSHEHLARIGCGAPSIDLRASYGAPFDPRGAPRPGRHGVEESGPRQRITLHECRHSYASLMIAAGLNAKALSTFMGHANIAITLDLYGHLMPGSEAQAADLLDTYLARTA